MNLKDLILHISQYSLFALTGLVFCQGRMAQAATLIDTFEDVLGTQQAIQRGGGGKVAIVEQPGTTASSFSNVIGGHRDLWLQAVSGTTNSVTRTAPPLSITES